MPLGGFTIHRTCETRRWSSSCDSSPSQCIYKRGAPLEWVPALQTSTFPLYLLTAPRVQTWNDIGMNQIPTFWAFDSCFSASGGSVECRRFHFGKTDANAPRARDSSNGGTENGHEWQDVHCMC